MRERLKSRHKLGRERPIVIHCREFESAWDAVLDTRPTDAPGPALGDHAAACPSCRAVHARNLLLVQALRSLGPPPAGRDGFAERVLAALALEPVAAVLSIRARVVRFAAAAAIIAALVVGGRAWTSRPTIEAPVAVTPPAEPADLTEALATATSATFDLAREASAPAARVGRQVLDSAEFPETGSALGFSETMLPAATVWRTVGDRVNAGVQPLGGSARHAFGFLLGSTPDDPAPLPAAPKRGA